MKINDHIKDNTHIPISKTETKSEQTKHTNSKTDIGEKKTTNTTTDTQRKQITTITKPHKEKKRKNQK